MSMRDRSVRSLIARWAMRNLKPPDCAVGILQDSLLLVDWSGDKLRMRQLKLGEVRPRHQHPSLVEAQA